MSKFAENLAEKTKPLWELLVKDKEWVWNESQQEAFEEVKVALMTSLILALYDPGYETVVSADASSFGLGTVLMHRQPGGERKPVAYISRSMSTTEQRYAQN